MDDTDQMTDEQFKVFMDGYRAELDALARQRLANELFQSGTRKMAELTIPTRQGSRVAPCPFCGSMDLLVIAFKPKQEWRLVVVCTACDTHGPSGASTAEARAKWNTRAASA